MAVQPELLIFHPLPAAPNFVGREAELAALRAFWSAGTGGVVALVGLGGAGKTAVAARFLDELLADASQLPRPYRLLVWSFYQEPDVGQFLNQAHRYFSTGDSSATPPARGAGLLHLLREALSAGGPHLLVLDGLERVQRPASDPAGAFGQIEDPLLKGLLTRLAESVGRSAVLVTSRFPLSDVRSLEGRGYTQVDVDQLDRSAARWLLRQRGVQGDDTVLDRLIEAHGAHALTLDHLGGLIGQFLGGDPARAAELTALDRVGDDRQALRLTRLLRAYEWHLPPAELTLLCRLCLLRRSVTEEQIRQLFLCSPPVRIRAIRHELAAVLKQRLGGNVDWLIRSKQGYELRESLWPDEASDTDRDYAAIDLSEAIEETIEEAVTGAPIAGPESTFLQEVRLATETSLELHGQEADIDYSDFARLYSGALMDTPTDLLPLPARDRERLRALAARYTELRAHPSLSGQTPHSGFVIAMAKSGLGQPPKKRRAEDLSYAELTRAFQRVRWRLRLLMCKHFALRRVRELCRVYQRKWSLAGPLAQADEQTLRRLLATLVERHLVVREATDHFSVHPAVRDHFHQLTQLTDQDTWHDIVREQLVSLSQRPGVRLADDPKTLDLLEEAIYHAVEAGRADEAARLYERLLGGHRHLGWKLGEMARGLRILKCFNPCPDRWALAWYLRALGEFDEALEHHEMPFFRADIRLLQGKLPLVETEGDDQRTAVAAFLMGKASRLPHETMGSTFSRAQLFLYLGRLHEARHAARIDDFYRDIGWEGERARCQLVQAEVARRQSDLPACHAHLNDASGWILHSGSVEHLCMFHLIRGRAATSVGDHPSAQLALEEGLHIARQCGLGLHHIELLSARAELSLARGEFQAAEESAVEALRQALAADCQFLWGAAEAGHLLGQAAIALGQRPQFARIVLGKTLSMRRRLGDPRTSLTEQLLATLKYSGRGDLADGCSEDRHES